MSLTVTVLDNETGDTATRTVADGDYVLVTANPCYLEATETRNASRTHVLTIRDASRTASRIAPSPPLRPRPPRWTWRRRWTADATPTTTQTQQTALSPPP